jgi:hypothetical protein
MTLTDQRPTLRKLFPLSRWTHHPDGRITLGVLLDAPVALPWLPAPKPCSRCKQPSWSGTVRGRAVHPNCDAPWFDRLTEEAYEDVVWMVTRALSVGSITEEAW